MITTKADAIQMRAIDKISQGKWIDHAHRITLACGTSEIKLLQLRDNTESITVTLA